jgi:SP family general alpha glucoside:H+ symporter-like MFS transporter
VSVASPGDLSWHSQAVDIADKIGRKWTVVTIYILLFIGITVETVSAQTSNPNAVFFAGKFINGFATGSLITTAMTYIGEVS